MRTDSFTEQGGVAALTTRGADTGVTFSTIGLRGESDLAIGGIALKASGSVAWRHAFGDTTPMTTVSLPGSDPFNIAGVPIAKDAALVEAGLSTRLNSNISLGVSYTGQFAASAQSQGVRGTLSIRF